MKYNDYLRTTPYRPHKSRLSDFCKECCCGKSPDKTTTEINHHNPITNNIEWFALYKCSVCNNTYIELNGKYKQTENLIKYEYREVNT